MAKGLPLGLATGSAHFDIGDLLAEDFGWCVPVKAHPYSIFVACAST
jgi:hypothetical protein